MIVWRTTGVSRHRHYHRVSDCRRLRAGLKRHGTTTAIPVRIAAMELLPCAECWPETAVKLFKPYCQLCETFRPCAHNGGILVKSRKGNRWVWPERACLHTLLRDVS